MSENINGFFIYSIQNKCCTFATQSCKIVMQEYNAIQLFEDRQIRVIWDDEQEKYFFSIVDVVQVLTDTPNARKYWSVLKTRLKKEGNELATNCSQLKMPAELKGTSLNMFLTYEKKKPIRFDLVGFLYFITIINHSF